MEATIKVPTNTSILGYNVILEPTDDETWTAEVPAFDLVTEGIGTNGARQMVEEAIRGYIKGCKKEGWPIPKCDIR